MFALFSVAQTTQVDSVFSDEHSRIGDDRLTRSHSKHTFKELQDQEPADSRTPSLFLAKSVQTHPRVSVQND